MTRTAAARQRASTRKRRYRDRLRSGGAVLLVPVRNLNAVINLVLSLGWLLENESEDRAQICAAVGEMLDDSASQK